MCEVHKPERDNLGLRPAENFDDLIKQLLRELEILKKKDLANIENPQRYKAYLMEMLSIMQYRLATGDLDAPVELQKKFCSSVELERLELYSEKNGRNKPLAMAVLNCKFTLNFINTTECATHYLRLFRDYQNDKKFALHKIILGYIFRDKYITVDEILPQIPFDISRERLIYILSEMVREDLLYSTSRQIIHEEATPQKPATYLYVFYYCTTEIGEDFKKRLTANKP